MSAHPGPVLFRLQRFVAAGHLRYWIILLWAAALASVVPWLWVAVWYAFTTATGLIRGWADQRTNPLPKSGRIAIATSSCIAWATAPLMAWFMGGANGDMLAAVLLGTGYFLVFTQLRAAPREALIVSSPYSVATAIILAAAWGEAAFLPVLAALPVLAIALLVKVLITQLKDDELSAVVMRQADLIVELEGARDQASAASEAKSNFLAVISHELRTPMNGVLGAAQLLDHAGLAPRDREFVRIIQGSGESLLSLLNDLLDVSKMEAGKLELHSETVDLPTICERLVGPCRTQAEAKGLALKLDCAPDLPERIFADPVRLGQVVQNLLSNAIKFTDAGQVTLSVSASQDAEDVVLFFVVRDTGPGIDTEGVSKLFQPFQQLDGSSTRRFGGTGLGLTIARRIARQMGGDVTVSSWPGEGSEFVFTARAERRPDIALLGPVPAADDTCTDSLSLLVVEDHPVNRMLLTTWLTAQGHRCCTADDGEDALAAVAREAFDMIVMDINMPVMDGLTATRRLRSQPGPNRTTPVIVLSASARPQDHQIGLAAGADAYLNKPVDFAALAAVLAQRSLGLRGPAVGYEAIVASG